MTSSAANREEHFSLETGSCPRCRRTVRGKRNAFGGSTCFDVPLNITNEVAHGVCLACYGDPSRSQHLIKQRIIDPRYKSQRQIGARRQSLPTQHEQIHQSGDLRRQSLSTQHEHIHQSGDSSTSGNSPAKRSVDGRRRRGEESSHFQNNHSNRGATQQSSFRVSRSQVAEHASFRVAEDRNADSHHRMHMVESDFAAASYQSQNSEGKIGGHAGGLTILESLLLKKKSRHGKSLKHSLKKRLGLPSKKQRSLVDETMWKISLSQNSGDDDVSVLGMEGW
jgi:hypothetical protein